MPWFTAAFGRQQSLRFGIFFLEKYSLPAPSHWGSWPQSFVNFQNGTGLGTYWYSSGGAADAKKPQDPVSVSYTLGA